MGCGRVIPSRVRTDPRRCTAAKARWCYSTADDIARAKFFSGVVSVATGRHSQRTFNADRPSDRTPGCAQSGTASAGPAGSDQPFDPSGAGRADGFRKIRARYAAADHERPLLEGLPRKA